MVPSFDFEQGNLCTAAKEVRRPAHDGEKIPLSIIHKNSLEKNGKNPTLLIGYGAYGISYEPV